MTLQKNPTENTSCWECDAPPETWHKMRRLPQIGQTYACAECGNEAYVDNAAEPGAAQNLQLRPVTRGMARNLQFFAVVEDWPDSAVEDLVMQGVERPHAIDYHIVEREGITQTEWADKRGVDQSTVSENVAKAREHL